MGEVLRFLTDGEGMDSYRVSPEDLASMIRMIDEQVISGKIAKMVFEEMAKSGRSPNEIIEEKGLKQLTDSSSIEAVVDRVLRAHAKEVEEYRSGKDKLFTFFVGQIMKATGGKANPKIVGEVLKERLRFQ
jgi:aspartyl-tRNA(Asn)/glutamyl-tRNA(Gln) amidotransferase subunit B